MGIFGKKWLAHEDKLAIRWRERVAENDLVIIAGDISWAMRESEAHPDFAFLRTLPGIKILLRGNHDYWWSTRRRVERLAGNGFFVLQNNALAFPGVTIVGTRGWELPQTGHFQDEQDESIYRRELTRLRLSLEAGRQWGQPLFAALHYPPLLQHREQTDITALLEEYHVSVCVYGHLHGQAHSARVEGEIRGVSYHLVASDFLDFEPLHIDFPAI